MTSGLFVLPCPHCGTILTTLDEDVGVCSVCRQTYLTRMGYLISIDLQVEESEIGERRETTSL